ncbi:MAG: hypothetical protein RL685_7708, partial [Pseudomonadota bacterium]
MVAGVAPRQRNATVAPHSGTPQWHPTVAPHSGTPQWHP